jgi:division protein CdvB (Snf7/Vps24/ESCRT-III family)
MPTQEERLNTLEKSFTTFREVASKHIQETDENTTIMLGVIRHQGQDIRRIFQRLETVDNRLETMDNRLETIEGRLHTMEQHFDRLKTIEGRLHTMEQHFDRLETKFDEHTTLLTQILARLPGTT